MSYNMEGHAKKCGERCCELAKRTIEQVYKVATPCLDGHQFKEEKWSQIVLKSLHWARIGRRDILWSVNKLAREDHQMDQSS